MKNSDSSVSRRGFIAAGAGTVAAAAVGSGCARVSRRTALTQPNLVFVMGDQWRRHALGFMNEDPVLTPVIDRFAGEGLVFSNALSCCPVCGPYRGTLMTGRYPLNNGVIHNGLHCQEDLPTFAGCLADAGYRTGYIGKWHIGGVKPDAYIPRNRRMGFHDWYAAECCHRHFAPFYYGDSPQRIDMIGWAPDHETDKAMEYIREHGHAGPFALFLSWSPPHTIHGGPRSDPNGPRHQYAAPRRFEVLYEDKDLPRRPNVPDNYRADALPGYFGAVTSLDENFGRLLACLEEQGLAENTIVVLTADHGEMLGSQGGMTKCVPYEESIGIPFIMRWPGGAESGVEPAIFNSVDVMPSLLSLMGVKIPRSVEGQDLSSLMQGRHMPRPEAALIEYFRDAPDKGWRGLRTERYTFVGLRNESGRRRLLFDNEEDPYQMNPKEAELGDDPLMDELWHDLRGRLKATNDPWIDIKP